MKSAIIAALACLVFSKSELFKISGKWFNKVTITSEDGTTSKTIYTPIDQIQIEGSNFSKSTGMLKPSQGILGGSQRPNQSQKQRMRKKIKYARSNLIKNSETKLGAPFLEAVEEGADQDNNLEEHEKQEQYATQTKTAGRGQQKSLNSQAVLYGNKIAANQVGEQRIKIAESEATSNSIVNSPFRKVTQSFKDTESPFSERNKMTSDGSGNLSSHESNSLVGKQNVVDGRYNEVVGNRNTIENGNYNQVRGDRNVIQKGHSNVILGDGSYVRGSGNIIY